MSTHDTAAHHRTAAAHRRARARRADLHHRARRAARHARLRVAVRRPRPARGRARHRRRRQLLRRRLLMTAAGRTVELTRYRIPAGQRALNAQRIDGRVAVIDVPVDHDDRVYLVERHVDSQAELQGLATEYAQRSETLRPACHPRHPAHHRRTRRRARLTSTTTAQHPARRRRAARDRLRPACGALLPHDAPLRDFNSDGPSGTASTSRHVLRRRRWRHPVDDPRPGAAGRQGGDRDLRGPGREAELSRILL